MVGVNGMHPGCLYKTEFYHPTTKVYHLSSKWINLFVFVKDPKNKVRQVLTLFSLQASNLNA